MNLLIDQWIPVKKDGAPTHISYKELLCTDYFYELSHPRDDMELAALQLLICLTQCIFMPINRNELVSNIKSSMDEDNFENGIKDYVPWFSLDDSKYPFMQDVDAKDEVITAIQKLLPGMPEGEGSATLFVDDDAVKKACPSCVAIALFNQATNTPSFGGGTKAPLRGSAPITLLVYAQNLREKIWKNILDFEWATVFGPPINIHDKPVWVEKLKKNSLIPTASIGMMRGLLWQPAYVHMDWISSQEATICPCCGRTSKVFCEYFKKNKFPYSLTGPNWRHPHSPYIFDEKRNELEVLSFNKGVSLPLWSRLSDILPIDSKTITGWSLPVKRYKELKTTNDPLPLVVGGYRNKQASILDRRHEMISIGAHWIKDNDNLNTLHAIIAMVLSFRDCLNKKAYSFGKSIDQSSNIASGIANQTNNSFFQDTELLMHKFISSEQDPDFSQEMLKELKKVSMKIFEETTEPYLSNINAFKSYLINKVGLNKQLNNIINDKSYKNLILKGENNN